MANVNVNEKTEAYANGSMAAAASIGMAMNEAMARGLIKKDGADFLVARSGELYAIVARGGSLTRDERGIYFEDKTKKETGNDE